MEKTAESISQSELDFLSQLKQKHSQLTLTAEKAKLETQIAEQAHYIEVCKLFIKYGLSTEDKIDNSGVILRKKQEVVE